MQIQVYLLNNARSAVNMRMNESQSGWIATQLGQEQNTGLVISPAAHPVSSFAKSTFPDFDSRTSMKFAYPKTLPSWQFMPFMPTYHPSPQINLFQLHMQQMAALQYDATLIQPGIGTFITPHVAQLILQLDQYQALSAGPHQDRVYEPKGGRHKTAASSNNHFLHASFSTIASDQCSISHQGQARDFDNARSGSAGGPPSSGTSATPNRKSRSRAALQNRNKRASAVKGQRKCDGLLQYVIPIEGGESGRPWKRRRKGSGQPTANVSLPVASMASLSVALTPVTTRAVVDEINEATESTNAPRGKDNEVEQQDIPMGETGDVNIQGEPIDMKA